MCSRSVYTSLAKLAGGLHVPLDAVEVGRPSRDRQVTLARLHVVLEHNQLAVLTCPTFSIS